MAERKELKYQPIPLGFIARIKEQYPPDIAEQWLYSLEQATETSVRLNLQKDKNIFEQCMPVMWCDSGRHLIDRPLFAADPFYHGGVYYPQESSSMILEWILQQLHFNEACIDALDVAAAPGGKTLILADFLKDKGRVIANEIDARRCAILEENISRWGCDNVVVTQGTSAELKKLPHLFHIILLDAPCSGEGMFRKDYHARAQWNEQLIHSCAAVQKNILNDITNLIAPEGFLIYSTCTFSDEENLHQLDQLIASGEFESISLQPEDSWGISIQAGKKSSTLQFIPGKVRGEGLTIGVLKKRSNPTPNRIKPISIYRGLHSTEQKKIPVAQTEIIYSEKKNHYVYSQFQPDELNRIHAAIAVKKSGITIGQLAGDAFIPEHDLAMSPRFNNYYPSVQVDEFMARRFLSGETWPLELSPGWYKVEYENVSLGWIKSLGNRFNNYLPKPLRLRSRAIKEQ